MVCSIFYRYLVNSKSYAFLGQYLVGKGLITESQLNEAIRVQKESTSLIGIVAVDQGFINKTQLDRLIEHQGVVDAQLGELAIQAGYMSEDQLAAVLAIQGENHVYLGESLVRMGMISNESLNETLVDFEAQITSQEEHVRAEIGNLPVAKELLIILDVTLRFFYRLGYAIHIVGRSDTLPDYIEYLFCSEQNFKNQYTRYMCMGMSSVLVESIAQGANRRQKVDGPGSQEIENMSQLVFNLNYLICKVMKKLDIRVKHGDAFIGLPQRHPDRFVCIEMETVTSPMVIAYGY